MPEPVRVEDFEIIENFEGDLAIMLPAGGAAPASPRLLFDGRERLLLYRTADHVMCLADVAHEAAERLKTADEVMIAEHDEKTGLPVRAYTVPVKMKEKLPT